jgi:hypothetical protein
MAVLIGVVCPWCLAAEQELVAGKIYVWTEREYSAWDNPLHSEMTINGQTVNIFSSDTFEPVEQYLKQGWNDIAIKTKPQEPAAEDNQLTFRIGPMRPDPSDSNKVIMSPVIWEFCNGTDWKLEKGVYSIALGPDVKEVTLSYHVYWAGLDHEGVGLKAGDYVLQGKPAYTAWNTPVAGTVFVNGTALNSFLLANRQIVVTPLLKPGKNEIKLVSARVKNSLQDNDIEFFIGGPAEWNVGKNQFLLKPMTEFKAHQGWTQDANTGQLVNSADPNADTIERTIEFIMKEPEKVVAPAK